MAIQNQLDPREADRLMSYVLEHYVKHYESIMRKLGHARTATHKSIGEIEDSGPEKEGEYAELAVIQSYDTMWDKVIKLYSNAGISEEELEKIDSVLAAMPKLITKYYQVLVKQDEVLQALLTELQSEEYRDAIEKTREVQAQPDRLSGLSPREFEPDQIHNHAFMFKIHTRN